MLPVYTYPMRNMIPNLVYSARGPEVALAAVDGEIIMRDGVFTKVDQQEYLSAIPKYPDDIGQRAAKEFFEIDGTNAHFYCQPFFTWGAPGADKSLGRPK